MDTTEEQFSDDLSDYDLSDCDKYMIYKDDYDIFLDFKNRDIKVDNSHINFYHSKTYITQFLFKMFVAQKLIYGDEPYRSRLNIKLAKVKLHIFLYYRKLKLTKYYSEFIKMVLPYEINTKIIDLCMK